MKLLFSLLDKQGANITTPGNTALLYAAKNGHLPVVELLLQYKADINAAAFDGATALWKASTSGDAKIVETLLKHGAAQEIDAVTLIGATPLYSAAGEGHLDVVNLLLKHGADTSKALKTDDYSSVDFRQLAAMIDGILEKNGESPLFTACAGGHVEIVERLLAHGANVDQARADGTTPFRAAKDNGHEKVMELLKAKGAKGSDATVANIFAQPGGPGPGAQAQPNIFANPGVQAHNSIFGPK